MAKYEVTVIERLFIVGTVEIEADDEVDALIAAGELACDDYDAIAWGDMERVDLEARSATIVGEKGSE